MPKIWMLGVFGPIVMLLGVYLAGGTEVVCTRIGAPGEVAADSPPPSVVGSCRVQTKRWFGRRVVEERTYLRVTGVDRIAVSRTQTSSDSGGHTRSWTVNDWSLQLMSNGVEIERIGGSRGEVNPAYEKGQAWFAGEAGSPLTLDSSMWRWGLGAIGLGVVYLAGIAALQKATVEAMSGTRRRKRRR